MDTFTEIRKLSDIEPQTFVDDTTPVGHFIAVTVYVGVPTVYLLKGELDQADAPIVGRIEMPKDVLRASIAYKGSYLKGGSYAGRVYDQAATFLRLVDEDALV